MVAETRLNLRGFDVLKGYISPEKQASLVETLRPMLKQAPLIRPTTPGGRQMSIRITSAGSLGWVIDRKGHHYAVQHPSGVAWPAIPDSILDIWHTSTGLDKVPDCCLINFYGEGSRLGLHQDKDEADFSWPVVSVSLGDDALFRVGNTTKGGKTESIWLNSGDVVVMGGDARLAYHGVDRIRFGSSTLLPKGGRINLTLRVVS